MTGADTTYISKKWAMPKFNGRATRGTFFARDNVSGFISWAKDLGVNSAALFVSILLTPNLHKFKMHSSSLTAVLRLTSIILVESLCPHSSL